MFAYNDCEIALQSFEELLADGQTVTEIWKLSIDASNGFDIIMLDMLEVFLLQQLRVLNHLLVETVVLLRCDVLKPVL
jgi:hypothetical protein